MSCDLTNQESVKKLPLRDQNLVIASFVLTDLEHEQGVGLAKTLFEQCRAGCQLVLDALHKGYDILCEIATGLGKNEDERLLQWQSLPPFVLC